MGIKEELLNKLAAVEKTITTMDEALDLLDEAKQWGYFDLIGGMLVTSYVKQKRITQSERIVLRLHQDLKLLQFEISDLDLLVRDYEFISKSQKVRDILLDNPFTDWSTQSKINTNIDRLEILRSRLIDLQVELVKNINSISFGD